MKKIYILSNPVDGFTNFVGSNLFNGLKNQKNPRKKILKKLRKFYD